MLTIDALPGPLSHGFAGVGETPLSDALTAPASGLDLICELRLRRWARQNYVPPADRLDSWHQVILAEMAARDEEATEVQIPDTLRLRKFGESSERPTPYRRSA